MEYSVRFKSSAMIKSLTTMVESKREYWKEYKDKKVKSMAILTTNGEPELCIEIEEEKINENNM